jgi:hypothetical protein
VINPDWSVIDLDPVTWRALGHFFDPKQYIRAAQPGEHGLFILHDNKKLLRIVDTQQGLRADLAVSAVKDPVRLAHQLYQTGEWQRVHVIDKRHLARVATLVSETPHQNLHLDEYYHLIYRLVWEDQDGYVCMPPKPDSWNGWRLGNIKTFVSSIAMDSTLAIGVLDQGRIEIGLILQIHEGIINRVTTFEALDLTKETLQVGSKLLEIVWQQLGQKFTPPAAVLLCTPAVFEAWINGENKRLVLQLAITASTAALAIRKDIDPTGLSGYASPKEA